MCNCNGSLQDGKHHGQNLIYNNYCKINKFKLDGYPQGFGSFSFWASILYIEFTVFRVKGVTEECIAG